MALLVVGLALWARPVAAQRRALDYGLAGASTALILADWSQTATAASDPAHWQEANLILGRHPSVGRVHTYFAVAVVANLGAFALPKVPRRVWYGVMTGMELVMVLRNRAYGLRICIQ